MYGTQSQNRYKKPLIILIIIALVAFFTYWFWPSPKIKNLPSQGTDIVAFGDSLVAGVGATPGKNFVSLLSAKLGINIINRGRSGETTGEGLNRVSEAIGDSPRAVILLLGGNDALRRIPVDQTFNNLRQVIEKIQAKGAVVVLLGVRGGLLSDKYSSGFKKLAKETGSLFVSDVLDGLFGHPDLMSDEIHPNDKGYAIIANRVAPVIVKALATK